MKPSITPLRPEALPPVRSALPLVLALATALLAGAVGGFVMRSALPGEVEVRVEERLVPPYAFPLGWFVRRLDEPLPAPCVKTDPPAVELKLLNSKAL